MFTHGSLFTGIGGFDLGFDRAGMTSVWQVEIDKYCNHVLRRHWPDVIRKEDVRDVGKHNLQSVNLVSGGFPCQDLSVAGKRAGLAGEHSGLFYEFIRIVDELSPQWVLIENVPGLLSSNDGGDMATVLWGLEECGYGWAYRVLDAQFFGVPQRRRRVFIIGCLGDQTGAPEVLFESQSSPWDTIPSREAREINSASAGGNPETFGSNGSASIDVSTALSAHKSGRYDFESETFVCFAENTRDEVRKLRTDMDPAILTPVRGVRRLTPVERERLQGFPDNWTASGIDEKGESIPISDAQRRAQTGNAVCVNVAQWIGQRIMKVDRGQK